MRAPDPLHLALLIAASANALVIVPVCCWIGSHRATRNRLPWAKRVFLGLALGFELFYCEGIIVALSPSLPPLVATDLVWLGFACVLAGALVLVYAWHWRWLAGW